jgi:hypothetical protein
MQLPRGMAFFAGPACLLGLAVAGFGADHNDPNAINSILGDIAAHPATKDPHILYHAGIILLGAGEIPAGNLRLQETVLVNPRHHTFHVRRG